MQLQQQQWQALQCDAINQQFKLMMSQMTSTAGGHTMVNPVGPVNPATGPSATRSIPPISEAVHHSTADESYVAADEVLLHPSQSFSDSNKPLRMTHRLIVISKTRRERKLRSKLCPPPFRSVRALTVHSILCSPILLTSKGASIGRLLTSVSTSRINHKMTLLSGIYLRR